MKIELAFYATERMPLCLDYWLARNEKGLSLSMHINDVSEVLPIFELFADVPGQLSLRVDNQRDCSGEFYALAAVSAPNVELTHWAVLTPMDGAAGLPR